MKVAFLGDSITEGVPGASFVNIVKESLKNIEVTNYGVGGDTVMSLLHRVKKLEDLHTYDVIVLSIGINDLFGKVNLQHRLIKILSNQKVAKSTTKFKEKYMELLLYLKQYKKRIIVIPPLLLGEQLDNEWNKQVEVLANIVSEQVRFMKGIELLDMRSVFVKYLAKKKTNNYIPYRLSSIKRDVDTLQTNPLVDSKAQERRLHLTLDGVHLNSVGANMIAREVVYQLQKTK